MEAKYDQFRTLINPRLRKWFGVELFKVIWREEFVGVGIRKELAPYRGEPIGDF